MRASRTVMAGGLALLTACSLAYPLGDDYTRGSDKPPSPDGSGVEASNPSESGPLSEAGANDPTMLAYGSVTGRIHLRRWDESAKAWGPASDGPLLDATKEVVRQMVLRRSPVNGRRILGVLTSAMPPAHTGTLHVYDWNGAAFVEAWSTNDFGSRAEWKTFDIAWEGNGARALAIYEHDSDGQPRLRIRDDNGWSGESLALETPFSGGLGLRFVEIDMQSHGNEAFLLASDPDDRFIASKWNGTQFAAAKILGQLPNDTHKDFAGAWEETSGDFLIAAAEGTISTVSIPHGQGVPDALGPKATNRDVTGKIVLASQPGSDRIAMAALEQVCGFTNCDDFTTQLWNGNGFDPLVVVDGDISTSYADWRPTTSSPSRGRATKRSPFITVIPKASAGRAGTTASGGSATTTHRRTRSGRRRTSSPSKPARRRGS